MVAALMFDTKRFLADTFGHPDRLIGFAGAYGYPVRREAVVKWFQRDSVPSAWMPVLLAIKELEDGQPMSLAGYLVRT